MTRQFLPVLILAAQPDGEERHRAVLVSGEYPGQNNETMVIQHSALVAPGNEWKFDVKCRPVKESKGAAGQRKGWSPIKLICPNSSVEMKHNDIEVTLPSPREDLTFAAFGNPGKDDKKRMQMAIYARKAVQGRDWKIFVHLFDDTLLSFKVVFFFCLSGCCFFFLFG